LIKLSDFSEDGAIFGALVVRISIGERTEISFFPFNGSFSIYPPAEINPMREVFSTGQYNFPPVEITRV